MKGVLTIAQILISVVLSGLILLQAKGVGLGRTFGAASYHSKRGVEKLVFKSTIAASIIFASLSVVTQLFIK